jgi:hypothetical protein
VRASFNDFRGAHAAAPYGLCAELIMLKPFFTKPYLPLCYLITKPLEQIENAAQAFSHTASS